MTEIIDIKVAIKSLCDKQENPLGKSVREAPNVLCFAKGPNSLLLLRLSFISIATKRC